MPQWFFNSLLTRAARKLEQHAGNNPTLWGGRLTGNVDAKDARAKQVFDEIMRGLGELSRDGRVFIKRLIDGRGIRVEIDGSFDSFMDPFKWVHGSHILLRLLS
jgi:hypothetical protein